MRQVLLGIDIGTSACKVAAFSPAGELLAWGLSEYAVSHPRPGWAEQDPVDWWRGAVAALQALFAQGAVTPREIAAIGIDGQSWAAVAMDAAGEVLLPTPIWMDTRAAGICDELRAEIGEETFFARCGNPLQPTYTLPKILWYRRHLPEVYQRIQTILQCNSYLVYCLTGRLSQDLSQGYGLQCFDLRRGVWDAELCKALDLSPSLLPDPLPCHQVVGGVTWEAAALTGLIPGTPVVAGGLDAACGTLGAGVLRPGEAQEQGGQAGGMSICIDEYHSDPRLILGFHVVPGKWLLQGGTVGGGGVVRWLMREIGSAERDEAEHTGVSAFAQMDALAEGIPPGSEGLRFLPYLAGERSPLWNPRAKGVYYGLDYTKTRGHLYRAAMEGAAFALRHNLEVAREAGVDPAVLRAMGGAAGSRFWTQMKADITAKPIQVPASDEATTLGAAMLAGVGVGVYGDFEQAVDSTVTLRREHAPDPALAPVYDAAYDEYLELYERLKPMMDRKEGEPR